MICYEWDIETVDVESDDIIDHDHRDRLSEYGFADLVLAISQNSIGDGSYTRLVLVRDVMDEDGVKDRSWAYLTGDGELPVHFLDAGDSPVAKVPARFVRELFTAGKTRP